MRAPSPLFAFLWLCLSFHIATVLGSALLPPQPVLSRTPLSRRHEDAEAAAFPRLAQASSDDLEAARKVIDAAIVEMRVLNRRRLDHPARNAYRLAPETQLEKRQQRESDDDEGVPPLLEITTEIASAAALLAEAEGAGDFDGDSSANVTETSDLQKRAGWWMEGIIRRGKVAKAWGGNTEYKVFRDVTTYGADKTGAKDSTKAIMDALLEGNRCAKGCNGSTKKNAIVYFPPGTYLVSSTIEIPFGTQLIGDAISRPIIKASSKFVGLGVLSTNKYIGGEKPGPDGGDASYYVNTANFYRQIRNFKIDIRATDKAASVCAIHYQIAQATSLQFVELIADSSTTQQGMFSENGSGGVMSDVVFNGGAVGFYGGNQQFSADRMTFKNCKTAVQIIWDWGWVWKSLRVDNSDVGFRLVGDAGGNIGSVSFIDSIMTNVKTAIIMAPLSPKPGSGTSGLILDNTKIAGPIKDTKGATIVAAGTYNNFVIGPVYKEGTRSWTAGSTNMAYKRQASLQADSKVTGLDFAPYFERAKPQYEGTSADTFKSLKGEGGAKGSGVDDDTKAVQAFFNKYGDGKSIIFVDAGVYLLTDTVTIPKNARIVGEMWAQFAASGSKFSDSNKPRTMLKVGNAGDVGNVEMQDLILTTQGGTAGAVLMEWNVKAEKKGSAGLWDVHVRIGGALGTGLTHTECPAKQSSPKAECQAASLMFHLKKGASGYFDNMWLWVADHTIDDPDLKDEYNTMIQCSIYVARGFLIESQEATWLYGTSSEHAVMYQYNFNGARNIFTTMIQTEEPYFQPTPKPPAPFGKTLGLFSGDPKYACTGGLDGCDEGWAVIMKKSQNIHIAGAGTYSWFSSYSQTCVDKHSCQEVLWYIGGNYDNVRISHIIAIGAKYTMVHEGKGVLASDDLSVSGHPQWSQISIFNVKSAGSPPEDEDDGGDDGGGGDNGSEEACNPDDNTFKKTETRKPTYFADMMLEPTWISWLQYVTIVNLTPYRLVWDKAASNSYQIDIDFGDIPQGRSRQNVCKYAASGNSRVDDNADLYYNVVDKNNKVLHMFHVKCTQNLDTGSETPYRTIIDLADWGLGYRELRDPREEVPVTWVLTGSESYGYYHSLDWKASGDEGWMKQHLDAIKDRQLWQVAVPGSHDSGMSLIRNAILGSSSNTQTQALNFKDQLRAGVRYLDFRVYWHKNEFTTGHFSGVDSGGVILGANGQSLLDSIDNINSFTKENPGEVIVVYLAGLATIASQPEASRRRWDKETVLMFWTEMEKINNRCPDMDTNEGDKQIRSKYVRDLSGKNSGNGCVIIVQDGWLADDVLKEDTKRGFYKAERFGKTDHWSNMANGQNMAEDQMKKYSGNFERKDYTISQWVMTPSFFDFSAPQFPTLEGWAEWFSNPSVYFAGLMAMAPDGYPTVLMQDYVGPTIVGENTWSDSAPQLKTLALGINLYLASENCSTDKRKHPLHKKRNALAMGRRPSPWNGAVFANGTRMEEIPYDWVDPFCTEVWPAGTRFGNGTVLEEDTANPACKK